MTFVAVKRIAGDRADWPAPTRIAARLEPGLALRVRDALAAGRAAVDQHALLVATTARDVVAIAAALKLAHARQAMATAVASRLIGAVLAGADLAATALAARGVHIIRSTADAEKATVGVDLAGVNPDAVEWARQHAADLVLTSAEIQAIIRAFVVESQIAGIPVRQLARLIYDVVGLDPRRAAAVVNFERTLRAQGKIAEAKLAARVSRYADAQRKARALLIARTETINALAHGQQLLWDKAAAKGLLDRRTVGKTWITTDDELLCPECEALDGVVVGLDETWDGDLDGPPAHPACRCATGLAEFAKGDER